MIDISDASEIGELLSVFYKNLCGSKKPDVHSENFVQTLYASDLPSVTEHDAMECEKGIFLGECYKK